MASAEVFHGVKLVHNIKDTKRSHVSIYTTSIVRDFQRLALEKGHKQYAMGLMLGIAPSNAQSAMSRYVIGTSVIKLKELELLNAKMREWGHPGWSDEALLACHAHDVEVRTKAVEEARRASGKALAAQKKAFLSKKDAMKAKNEEIGRVLKPEPPPPNRAVGFVLPKKEPLRPQDVRADVVAWARKAFNMKPTDPIDSRVIVDLDPLVSSLTKFIIEYTDK